MKVEGEARVWYARSHGGKKLGKKSGGMRRMMNCGWWQAGRGGAGKNCPPPSLAAQSRVIRGVAGPYVDPVEVRNHDINLLDAKERP